jgi:hypothetical protein
VTILCKRCENEDYENIYPAPVAEVAARFRMDWVYYK